MRRRLTVTGASENIDGATAKLAVSESQELKKVKKKANKVSQSVDSFFCVNSFISTGF
jgi:hypothetical protein